MPFINKTTAATPICRSVVRVETVNIFTHAYLVACVLTKMESNSVTSVSLVAPQASITVNTCSVAQSNRRVDRPKSRGVVITPISQAQGQQCLHLISNLINQPVTQHEETVVIPKVPIKAVSKSSLKKDASNKTFTLRDVNVSRVQTYDQLKEMILSQL